MAELKMMEDLGINMANPFIAAERHHISGLHFCAAAARHRRPHKT
jgi:hypothetical protein